MNPDITLLSLAESRLLTRAGIELLTSEFKDIINFSIQHGPSISLKGPLHCIEENEICPASWQAMMEFIDWGAGFVVSDVELNTRHLLADSNHVKRLMRLIAQRIERNSGQNEKQETLNRRVRLPLVKLSRKHSGSLELG